MQKQTGPRPPSLKRELPPAQRSFGRTFLWVFIIHVGVLLALAFFRLPEKKESPPQIMEMISLPSAASGSSPAPSITLPAISKPTPVTPPPVPPVIVPPIRPQPVPPVTAEEKLPTQSEAPSRITLPAKTEEKPKPKIKPVQTTTLTPQPSPPPPDKKDPNKNPKKEKHTIVVNLTPATNNMAESQPTKSNSSKPAQNPHASSAPSAPGPSVNPSEIANELGQSLKSSGATKSIGAVGVSGAGGSSGEFGAFYKIIQEQMYQAWEPPRDLPNFKQATQVQIHVAPDGTILEAKIISSSGNPRFDASALAAARQVGRLHEARPEGCPEFITINFRLG